MTDFIDQGITGSTCMFYRRQSRGVLLKNKCDMSVKFAVEQKAAKSSGKHTTVSNVYVSAKSQVFHNTGGSDNVVSVGIGS